MITTLVTVFINLESSRSRWESLVQNFNRFGSPSWKLERFSAISVSDVERSKVEGLVRSAEKACYLSHLAAIEAASHRDVPTWIREDDTQIGARSASCLDQALNYLNDDWDILFTDLLIGNPTTMLELLLARRGCKPNTVGVVPLAAVSMFAGAYGYVINPLSASRLHNSLATAMISLPFDIALRAAVTRDGVRSFFLFQFISTAVPSSMESSIRSIGSTSVHHLWDIYRRMLYVDGDLEQANLELDNFHRTGKVDLYSTTFGRLMEAMARETTILEQ